MPDKPSALSTIPPAEPAEPEYDALCSAVMATPRGRWFLNEYARRNRSSDTAQVLSAIERIGATITGQREHSASQGVRIELLEMARAIAQTRAEVAEHGPVVRLGSEPSGTAAAPDIGASAERLRDIAWTMRACGVELGTSEQIEQIAEAILSASSLRKPGGQQAQKLGEVLLYLEHRIDRMLDSHLEAARVPDDAESSPGPKPSQTNSHDHDAQSVAAAPAPTTDALATDNSMPAPPAGIVPAAEVAPVDRFEPERAPVVATANAGHSALPVRTMADIVAEPQPVTAVDAKELRLGRVECEPAPPLAVPIAAAATEAKRSTPEPPPEPGTAASDVAPAMIVVVPAAPSPAPSFDDTGAPETEPTALAAQAPIAAEATLSLDDPRWTTPRLPQIEAGPEPIFDIATMPEPSSEGVAAPDPSPCVDHASAPPPAEANPVAMQVEEDLRALTEFLLEDAEPAPLLAAAPAEPPPASPFPAPPPENDVLSSAWEEAVANPAVHAAAVKRTDPAPVPSMWGPPMRPIQPSPAAGFDAQSAIESELFTAPPDAIAALPTPPPLAAALALPDRKPGAPAVALPSIPPPPRIATKPMPRHAADDPLAALTAMTDEERIALFT